MLVLLVGMSGSGKTSVAKGLKYQHLISTTTRPPRDGEIDKVSYYFVTKEIFDKLVFVDKTKYAGYEYGHTVTTVYDALLYTSPHVAVVDSKGAIAIARYAESIGKKDRLCIIYLLTTAAKAVQNMRLRGDTYNQIIERLVNAIDDDELRQFEEINGYVSTDVSLARVIQDVHKCACSCLGVSIATMDGPDVFD